MSSPLPHDLEPADRDAALWSARLSHGRLTEAERQQLATWLQAWPENEPLLTRYRALGQRLTQQLPAALDPGEVDRSVAAFQARRYWLRGAVATLAAACIALVATTAWPGRPASISTQLAERRSVSLADGSQVDLNADSELHVDLNSAERHVTLVRGEALFHVAKDAQRPFFVHTDGALVRVTGTVFNVRETLDARVDVAVLEGSVQVRPSDPADAVPLPLSPGDQVRITGPAVDLHSLTPDQLQNLIAWRTGEAAFESESLAEAVSRFASYHRRGIDLAPEVAALKIGGRFNLNDLDGFLAVVEQVLPVTVIRETDTRLRIVARPRTGP